jgi:hypothetical protein
VLVFKTPSAHLLNNLSAKVDNLNREAMLNKIAAPTYQTWPCQIEQRSENVAQQICFCRFGWRLDKNERAGFAIKFCL